MREKNQITFGGNQYEYQQIYSIETRKVRRAWNNSFQAMKKTDANQESYTQQNLPSDLMTK